MIPRIEHNKSHWSILSLLPVRVRRFFLYSTGSVSVIYENKFVPGYVPVCQRRSKFLDVEEGSRARERDRKSLPSELTIFMICLRLMGIPANGGESLKGLSMGTTEEPNGHFPAFFRLGILIDTRIEAAGCVLSESQEVVASCLTLYFRRPSRGGAQLLAPSVCNCG
ncbi:uncharacterized protein LOC135164300 [Diachasmimorpha longicaudata]|uniref:uncharacterized protein LOC135164300 n=1 Tax=Diachasmimorpha longicaudata TaxID=58733 RepID=UPI0030B8B2B8